MGLLRSETMKFGMLVLPVQDSRKYVEAIGMHTQTQFEDMNGRDMQRPYRKFIRRIDEMDRILRYIMEQVIQKANKQDEIVKNKVDEFMGADKYNLDVVEADLAGLYKRLVLFKMNSNNLQEEYNLAKEELEVLSRASKVLTPNMGGGSAADSEGLKDADKTLSVMAGVIKTSDEDRFLRAVFRASRGNILTQFSKIEGALYDPKAGSGGADVQKSTFYMYFQGDGGALRNRVLKVCQGFGANMFTWPSSHGEATYKEGKLRIALKEKEQALEASNAIVAAELNELLDTDGANSIIEDYRLFCIKERSIYSVLDKCAEGMTLRVNIWYPANDEQKLKDILGKANAGAQEKAILMPDNKLRGTPPTYIRTNEYTEPWQDVIDTYGIPKYKEANPGALTIITFPFIFGMMYGDIGHGSMLLLTGIFLIFNAETFKYTQPVIYSARYVVFSLGFFATFAGIMYNDFFSVGLQLFESRFVDSDGDGHFEPLYDVTNSVGGRGPYPVGLDSAWSGTSNELLFVNSMKMKLSVLFGVLQMTVGVFLRWSNAFYEKNMTDFFCECIPMLIFMLCFFGWMDFMILYKWAYPVDNAPSIINSLICMAMGQEDLFPLWDGSVQVAQMFMKFTVCAVPIMLFPKPFILLWQHNQSEKKKGQGLLDVEEQADHGHGDHGEFEFGEIFIHQIIETIEFVLGTVSHTASYLRIWALSLAHQQLSLVFFSKTLTMGLTMPFPINGIVLYFMYAAWFGITLAVLLGMDVLECFLHTLRLHWVEFQSKFYKAGGSKFAPFSIRADLLAEEQ